MPKFMKDGAIALLDGAIESYVLALYGMSLPIVRLRRRPETRFAPVIGLLGATVELLAKACLVQAKGLEAMYKDGNIEDGIFRFGTEVLSELRGYVKENALDVAFLWKSAEDCLKEREEFVHYLDKFKLLQQLRANGLHAGQACSKDVCVLIFNDVYNFIMLLSQGKKLKAYLKNIPGPDAPVRDREAIIEDLTRRMNGAKNEKEKLGYLRNMYIVLPYIPELEPDWIKIFDKAVIVNCTPKVRQYGILLTDGVISWQKGFRTKGIRQSLSST